MDGLVRIGDNETLMSCEEIEVVLVKEDENKSVLFDEWAENFVKQFKKRLKSRHDQL